MDDTSRRALLGTLGVATCLGLGGSLAALGRDDERRRAVADRPAAPSTADRAAREDFVWLAPGLWRDDRMRENLVAFAARHDLTAVFSQPDVDDDEAVDDVLVAMRAASETGATPWLETGVPEAFTPKRIVEDASAREDHLDALRSAARRYAGIVPDGNLILWEEAPVGGRWTPSGEWTSASVRALERYGPDLYAHQRRAVAEAAPDLAAGVFLHFPYIVETRQPEVYANLMDALAAREVLPEFVFTDFYRGWYEKDTGPGPANAAVRSLVDNAARHARGRPVYFLGQAHTINPRHTSSTQAMRMDLRTATDAGARGVGWYARTAYKQTRRGFDPFVPNDPAESSLPGDIAVNTLTVARDRFLYAYRATLAARRDVDPLTRFDCWLRFDAPGFLGHRVSVWADGDWRALGDVACAHPDVTPVDTDAHVSVFHALDATRLLADGTLRLRVDTHDGYGGRLRGISVLPFDSGVAYTEREATRLVEAGRVPLFALGTVERDDALTPDSPLELTVPVESVGGFDALDDAVSATTGRPVPPVADLLAPGTLDHRIALATAEADAGFDRDRRFDLWLRTDGRADPSTLFDRFGFDAEPVTAAASDGAAVFWGVPRAVLDDDATGTLTDRVVGRFAGTTVEAAAAMPYFGSEDLRLPGRVATLFRESPDDMATFAFADAER